MIIGQTLDQIRSYVAKLENDLAEVDALIATHCSAIDANPPSEWPKGSILGKAMARHNQRCLDEISRKVAAMR